MTTLNDLARADFPHMLDQVGEAVTYLPQSGGEYNFMAIVDRNAISPPPNGGYEHTLSQRWHEFTFASDALVLPPKRGDKITTQGKTYTVQFIYPNDADLCTVAAR